LNSDHDSVLGNLSDVFKVGLTIGVESHLEILSVVRPAATARTGELELREGSPIHLPPPSVELNYLSIALGFKKPNKAETEVDSKTRLHKLLKRD